MLSSDLTILASLKRTIDGENPADIIISGHTLYGTTAANGNDYGEVFSLPVTGGKPTVLASFNGGDGSSPANLILSGSTLYGITLGGGAHDDGEVFSLPITGGTPTVLASFNGTSPSDLILSGNTLYGAADPTIFALPTSGGTPTILASFDTREGSIPGNLIVSGSTLYGVASGGGSKGNGTVFSLPTDGGTPTVLADLSERTEGENPDSLILSGSTLFGSTGNEGPINSAHEGTVFSLPAAGGAATVLASTFGNGGGPSDLILSDGKLYGTAGSNSVFSLPATGGTPTILAKLDGLPNDLILSGKTLYGTIPDGGSDSDGEVFALLLSATVPVTTPTITSATASASTHGYTIAASVIATDAGRGGAAGLQYYWTAIHLPAGAKMPTFNVNGTNAAQNIIARFSKDGGYILQCKVENAAGNSVTTDVEVTVSQKATFLKIEPHAAHIAKDATEQFTGTVLDQFNHPMRTPQTLTYFVASGSGSISSTGLFSATSIAGPVTIKVEADDLTGTVGAVAE